MNIVEEKIGDVLVEVVNLDRATLKEADDFKKRMNQRIDEGEEKIVIDLSACEFIDSTFLGVLVHSLKRINKSKGSLKLVGFKPAVKSMFELTRMFRVFDTYNDLQKAVESFSR